jgi:Reverse transcriptase (RNA-dependent DNA polymerase).
MSPKLCTYVLDNVFRNLNWGNRLDLRINDNRLYNLRFADDILLVPGSARVLRQKLLDLNEHNKTARLSMNFRKTKIMYKKPTEPFI